MASKPTLPWPAVYPRNFLRISSAGRIKAARRVAIVAVGAVPLGVPCQGLEAQ